MVADARSRRVIVNLAAVLQAFAEPLARRWFPPNDEPKAVLFQTAEIEARFIMTLPTVVPNFLRVLRYRPGYRRPVAE